MANGKKPFKDKKFYLDLRFYRHHDELVKNIKKLGGRVESFLSRDVTHVITDRPNLGLKQEPWMPGTPKSLKSSPRNVNSYDSVLGHFETPMNTSSSSAETVSTPALSRGLALVQKAKQKHQGTTDLLGVCNQWDIKVVQLKKVLSFINKFYLCSSKNNENHQPKIQIKDNVKCVPERLTPPFIKIEDQKRAYKPNYKVFKTWKDICDPNIWRIANQLKMQIQENKERSALRPSQLQNIMTNDLSRSPSMDSNLSILPSPGPSQVAMSLGTSSKMATIPVNYSADKIKRDHNTSKKKGHGEKKAPSKRYCEICLCTFTNLDEHIASKKHKDYVSDSSNFLVLKRIIATLPSASQFLKRQRSELSNPNEHLGPPVLKKMTLSTKRRCKPHQEKPLDKAKNNENKNDRKESQLNCLDMPDITDSAECEIIPASCSTEKLTSGSSETIFASPNTKDTKISTAAKPVKMDIEIPACQENLTLDVKLDVKDDLQYFNHCDRNADYDPNYDFTYQNVCLYGPINVPNDIALDASLFAVEASQSVTIPDGSQVVGFYELDYDNDFLSPANMLFDPTVEKMDVDNCSVVRAYPFTNFGYGWSGNSILGNEICAETCENGTNQVEDITGLNSNIFKFSAAEEMKAKEKDSDFHSSSDIADHWKDIKSEINNVCQSLGTCEDAAMDLSIKMTEVKVLGLDPTGNDACLGGNKMVLSPDFSKGTNNLSGQVTEINRQDNDSGVLNEEASQHNDDIGASNLELHQQNTGSVFHNTGEIQKSKLSKALCDESVVANSPEASQLAEHVHKPDTHIQNGDISICNVETRNVGGNVQLSETNELMAMDLSTKKVDGSILSSNAESNELCESNQAISSDSCKQNNTAQNDICIQTSETNQQNNCAFLDNETKQQNICVSDHPKPNEQLSNQPEPEVHVSENTFVIQKAQI